MLSIWQTTGKNPVALKIQGAPPIVDSFIINNANDFTLRGKNNIEMEFTVMKMIKIKH